MMAKEAIARATEYDEPPKEWDRRPHEPIRWYARLEAYRLMGPGRSLLATYNAEREKQGRPRVNRVPGTWTLRARQWDWKQRAEAWDAAEQAKLRAEYEEERRQDKELRLKILKGYRGKLVEAAAKLTPYTAEWRDVTQGLAMVLDEIRYEYGDDPSQAAGGPIDIVLHWADTPAEAQKTNAGGQ